MKEQDRKAKEISQSPKETFNPQKFEKTKKRFLKKVENAPDDTQKLLKQGIDYHGILGGVLYFLSLYNPNLSFGQIEHRTERIIKENMWGKDSRYDFADQIFREKDDCLESMTPYEWFWFRISCTWDGKPMESMGNRDGLKQPFTNTHWWREYLGPELKKDLDYFKDQNDPFRKQLAESVFAISEEVIKKV